MKILSYTIIVIGFALVTFFGLGPVIFADGPMDERIATLLFVLLLYTLLGWITIRFVKHKRHAKK